MALTLGTDPEVFIVDAAGNPVPAHRFFPPKEEPFRYHLGTIHRDGFAVEINPNTVQCREGLTGNVGELLNTVRKIIGPDGYGLSFAPTVKIDPASLQGAPPDVQLFGCDPSMCAYDMREKTPNLDPDVYPYRHAGGHLHIGASETSEFHPSIHDPDFASQYIRMLDLFVGIPMTYWSNTEGSFLRRQHYGQAGEFRFQTYDHALGLEYRTLEPFVWWEPRFASYALGVMRLILYYFKYFRDRWDKELEKPVRHAINTGEGLEELLRYAVIDTWNSMNILYGMKGLRDTPRDCADYAAFGYYTFQASKWPGRPILMGDGLHLGGH